MSSSASTATTTTAGDTMTKAIFYDMKHSNNAARIRLWLSHSLERNPNLSSRIESKVIKYSDLPTPEFQRVNPLKKVPGFIREDGRAIFEASVVLDYLEEKYNLRGEFVPSTPEGRQEMSLLVRLHDLYVASPNCTMPGFCHSQGAMYLTPTPTEFVPAVRCIPETCVRAKKIWELWTQLAYLNEHMVGGPYIMGDHLTLADFTWYPTTIYMESMLPRIFGWPDVFRDETILPKFSRWWTHLTEEHPLFAGVRNDIKEYWDQQYEMGHFDTIKDVVKDKTYQWKFPVQWDGTVPAMLNYQEPAPPGKRTGRYIDCPDKGELVDKHISTLVDMKDARRVDPPPSLSKEGFCLVSGYPSKLSMSEFVSNDANDDGDGGGRSIETIYYDEIRQLVKDQTGASRVFLFDHTVRTSRGATSLNATGTNGQNQAAPVPRVHCDYTEEGAPRRFVQLASDERFRKRETHYPTVQEAEEIVRSNRRFAFVNVWRSIDEDNPVLEKPLAVCDASSISADDDDDDRFLYELHFPHRVGLNYSLDHKTSSKHKWYTYNRMTHDECLLFKVYDRIEPKFVFHSAWTDPRGGFRAPPRHSVEVRTIALF